jgi:hypothetical protein
VGLPVEEVQTCFDLDADGLYGANTKSAVERFQLNNELDVDGVVGPKTWIELATAYGLPAYHPPHFYIEPLEPALTDAILVLAAESHIASYGWDDRGTSPVGYVQGMALAWASLVRRFVMRDPAVHEMAKANSGNADKDALAWYDDVFADLGIDNAKAGINTLRHGFVLLHGLGMRESSGQHCVGRDMSADNVTSDTAEAGLFQTSWNARSCSPQMQELYDLYYAVNDSWMGLRDYFERGVACSSSDWQSYGSGAGYCYQVMAKNAPAFAVDTTMVGLRNLRQHWGPINRYEAEVRPEADHLYHAIQGLILDAPSV